ncbi:MAG: energy transducer TonB [Elusimicrobia bacterium]|nr:energy transducer TonB [Elusimicrobiota bacterium]
MIFKLRSVILSFFINVLIFSFLPILHHFFHKPASKIKPIRVDIISPRRAKPRAKKKNREKDIRKPLKSRNIIKPEFRRRITFELDPNALASEVDLIAPMVTYNLSEVDSFPKLEKYLEPDYPDIARSKGIEGVVVLKILIDSFGRVVAVKIKDNGGLYEFGIAAARAVKQWRFTPAKIMGTPVAVWCIQKVRFKLKK